MYDTSYDGTAGYLVENPINRYLINSPMLPELKKNSDGSLTLFIQKDEPTDPVQKANWLPAPNGPIYTVLRMYWPKETVLNGFGAPLHPGALKYYREIGVPGEAFGIDDDSRRRRQAPVEPIGHVIAVAVGVHDEAHRALSEGGQGLAQLVLCGDFRQGAGPGATCRLRGHFP